MQCRPWNPSSRRGLWVVTDRFIQVSQLEFFMRAIRQFSYNTPWLASDDGEARNDHVGGNNRPVQDLDVVLDDGKLVDYAALSNVHMIAYTRSLHHRFLSDIDVIADPQRHIRKDALVDTTGRPKQHTTGQKAISTDGNGRGIWWSGASARWWLRLCRSDEIASDHDFGLDDGLSAQHDVLRADEDGLARDLVAGVLASRRNSY